MNESQVGGEGDRPDASERLKTLSADKKRLLDAMLRQRAANGDTPPPGGERPKQEADGPPDPTASLIAIKASGSRPPFFCVHAILGSAFPYFQLAIHLDPDQPFYGLQSPGLDGSTPPLESIEEMARLYIGLIRGVQPHGPYYLGGYSFGGWVAFEMAQQLFAAGEKVALLAMLGTGAPPSMSNPRLFEQFNFTAQYNADFRRLVLNSFLSDATRTATLDAPEAHGLSPLANVAAANNVAQFRYVPRPYADRITVFITGEQYAAAHPETTMGWKMLSVKEVPVHLVSGNHLSMFQDPHVRDLAEKLSTSLRLTQPDGHAGSRPERA